MGPIVITMQMQLVEILIGPERTVLKCGI